MTSENEAVQPAPLQDADLQDTDRHDTPDDTPRHDTRRHDTQRPAPALSAVRPVDPGSVHVLFEPATTKVVLTGEIDAELGPDLLEAADDALSTARPVEVDVHLVTFMDSTGVAFLARLASRAPGRVVLVDPPDVVTFLIETTRISSLLDVVRRQPVEGRPTGEA